ncbi:calphotin-like [Helianthus annuus]|uniref:calphotin-like n=1 Tax=Helianthus annuus TaxID=4232 RepID=UPI0016532909|nr:calphotin-like [Helianthus annuus]
MDQPLEVPVAPIDPLFDIPADFDMDLVDPEPVMAPEPVVAPDPAPEHDLVHDDAPALHHPLVDDPIVDIPLPDPVPALVDRAPFAAHIDPRYADTHNGWIEDDDDYQLFVLPVTPPAAPVSAPTDIPLFPPHTTYAHRTDLPITFLQDIPPPRPGEGSSRQPPISVPPVLPSSFPFTSQFPHVAPPIAPSFIPSSEPFLWTTPPVMPLSDPYHPYHVRHTTEDILTSLMMQQDALTRRIQELERASRPPCHSAGSRSGAAKKQAEETAVGGTAAGPPVIGEKRRPEQKTAGGVETKRRRLVTKRSAPTQKKPAVVVEPQDEDFSIFDAPESPPLATGAGATEVPSTPPVKVVPESTVRKEGTAENAAAQIFDTVDSSNNLISPNEGDNLSVRFTDTGKQHSDAEPQKTGAEARQHDAEPQKSSVDKG